MRLKKITSLTELEGRRETRVVVTRKDGVMDAGIIAEISSTGGIYKYTYISKVGIFTAWGFEVNDPKLGVYYKAGYRYGIWIRDLRDWFGNKIKLVEMEDPEDPATPEDYKKVLEDTDIIFDEAEIIMKEDKIEEDSKIPESPLEKALKTELKKITKKELSGIKSEVATINSFIKKSMKEELIIKVADTDKQLGKVKGLLHENLPHLIKLLNLRFNVLLTGSTGSGKTTGAMQAAEGLGLESYSISVGQQTSKSDIMGFINANGTYVTTSFREAYEHGGVFIMDEIDAGNSNVLIVINSALSNGVCNFPDKKVKQHKDFRFVATANTFGRGRDLSYVGRNALDLATLDRFMTVKWEYSENVEKGLRAEVIAKVKQARKYIEDKKIEGFISTRTAFAINTLVDGGESLSDAFDICIYNKLSEKEGVALMSTLFKTGALPY